METGDDETRWASCRGLRGHGYHACTRTLAARVRLCRPKSPGSRGPGLSPTRLPAAVAAINRKVCACLRVLNTRPLINDSYSLAVPACLKLVVCFVLGAATTTTPVSRNLPPVFGCDQRSVMSSLRCHRDNGETSAWLLSCLHMSLRRYGPSTVYHSLLGGYALVNELRYYRENGPIHAAVGMWSAS